MSYLVIFLEICFPVETFVKAVDDFVDQSLAHCRQPSIYPCGCYPLTSVGARHAPLSNTSVSLSLSSQSGGCLKMVRPAVYVHLIRRCCQAGSDVLIDMTVTVTQGRLPL